MNEIRINTKSNFIHPYDQLTYSTLLKPRTLHNCIIFNYVSPNQMCKQISENDHNASNIQSVCHFQPNDFYAFEIQTNEFQTSYHALWHNQ